MFKRQNSLTLSIVIGLLLFVYAFSTDTPGQKKANALSFNSFLNLNGVMWYYNTWFGTRFSDIRNDLANLQDDGINILAFFCPYNGDKNMYAGCDPLDWYDVPPQCGTLQDWKDLVAAAHSRGMKVICYFVNIYIDTNSIFFKRAERQYAAGNRSAKECATFCWQNSSGGAFPSPSFGASGRGPYADKWVYSQTAGAFYWSIWKEAALDFNQQGSINTATDIEHFWLDTGIDGFMFDCARTDPKMQNLWITIPKTYTSSDKWLCPEVSEISRAQSYYNYGFTCWFNYEDNDYLNDYGRIINGDINADGLDSALANSDWAHSRNCWTYAWSIWHDDVSNLKHSEPYPTYTKDDVMRVQEAALLAGAGITYGCGMYDQYLTWSPTLKKNWGKVLKMVNSYPSLLPSASRTRLSTGNLATYAMKRTSQDRSQTALLIYNFNNASMNVTVDLSDSGINTNQTPEDLYNGGDGPAITSSSYTVSLPAYGFKILCVSTNVVGPVANAAILEKWEKGKCASYKMKKSIR